MKLSHRLRELGKKKDFLFGFFLFLIILCLSLGVVLLSFLFPGLEESFLNFNLSADLLPPQKDFWLGTDIFGRSVLYLLIKTMGISLLFSFVVILFSSFLGVFVSYLTFMKIAFFSSLMEMITAVFFIFPTILMAILILSILSPSLFAVALVLVIVSWPSYAKISFLESKRIEKLDYIAADEAIGKTRTMIYWKSVLPAMSGQLLIQMVLSISGVIIAEATLSFLGISNNDFSFGELMKMAKDCLLEAPHLMIIFSFFFSLMVLGPQLIGDKIRDYLDIRRRM